MGPTAPEGVPRLACCAVKRRDFIGAMGAAAAVLTTGGLTLGPRPAGAVGTGAVLPWWDRGNFRPVLRERVAESLVVEGTLPRSLTGLYVRNGSNEHAGVPAHWFVGDGMFHGVWLEHGRARAYRSAWVQTDTLANGGAPTTGPPSLRSGYANVSAIWHAGRLLASGEIGLPWELDPHDLSTTGAYDFAGRLDTSMTAHPKIDPATGAMHFFGYWFAPPYLTYHVADASGALVHSEPVDIPRSTMIHDFAITERDVVFWDFPVVFDLAAVPNVQGLSHLPIIVDPSHATGRPDLIPSMALASIAAGADGVHIEVHNCPEKAMSDGPQALLPDQYAEVVEQMRALADVLGKTIPSAGEAAAV